MQIKYQYKTPISSDTNVCDLYFCAVSNTYFWFKNNNRNLFNELTYGEQSFLSVLAKHERTNQDPFLQVNMMKAQNDPSQQPLQAIEMVEKQCLHVSSKSKGLD